EGLLPGRLGGAGVVQTGVGVVEGMPRTLVEHEAHLLAGAVGGDGLADLLDLLERDEGVGRAEMVQARHVHLRSAVQQRRQRGAVDRKSTRLNSSHVKISYA